MCNFHYGVIRSHNNDAIYQYAIAVIFHYMSHDFLDDYESDIVVSPKKSVTMQMILGKSLLDVV